MPITKKEQKVLDELFVLARDHNKAAGASIAAAVVFKNKVVAFGFNQMKSHPLQNRYKKNVHAIFLHAEVDAIKNALRVITEEALVKCTLMVVRVKKDGPRGSFVCGDVKPCTGCAECITAFGIKKVIYSTDEGYDVF